MSSKIEAFLKLKRQEVKTETVTVKLQGIDFDFDIKEVEPELLSEIQIAHTVAIPSAVQGGLTTEGANPLKLSLDICKEAIIAPNLNDRSLQDHFGVMNARDLLYELFKHDMDSLGELLNAVLELSTTGEAPTRGTDPEDVKEAKN